MTKPIFTRKSTEYLVMSYPTKLLDEPGFGDMLDGVLKRFRREIEDGEPVFDYIEQHTGQVLIKFSQLTETRVVDIWFNRIEKAMQELYIDSNAA